MRFRDMFGSIHDFFKNVNQSGIFGGKAEEQQKASEHKAETAQNDKQNAEQAAADARRQQDEQARQQQQRQNEQTQQNQQQNQQTTTGSDTTDSVGGGDTGTGTGGGGGGGGARTSSQQQQTGTGTSTGTGTGAGASGTGTGAGAKATADAKPNGMMTEGGRFVGQMFKEVVDKQGSVQFDAAAWKGTDFTRRSSFEGMAQDIANIRADAGLDTSPDQMKRMRAGLEEEFKARQEMAARQAQEAQAQQQAAQERASAVSVRGTTQPRGATVVDATNRPNRAALNDPNVIDAEVVEDRPQVENGQGGALVPVGNRARREQARTRTNPTPQAEPEAWWKPLEELHQFKQKSGESADAANTRATEIGQRAYAAVDKAFPAEMRDGNPAMQNVYAGFTNDITRSLREAFNQIFQQQQQQQDTQADGGNGGGNNNGGGGNGGGNDDGNAPRMEEPKPAENPNEGEGVESRLDQVNANLKEMLDALTGKKGSDNDGDKTDSAKRTRQKYQESSEAGMLSSMLSMRLVGKVLNTAMDVGRDPNEDNFSRDTTKRAISGGALSAMGIAAGAGLGLLGLGGRGARAAGAAGAAGTAAGAATRAGRFGRVLGRVGGMAAVGIGTALLAGKGNLKAGVKRIAGGVKKAAGKAAEFAKGNPALSSAMDAAKPVIDFLKKLGEWGKQALEKTEEAFKPITDWFKGLVQSAKDMWNGGKEMLEYITVCLTGLDFKGVADKWNAFTTTCTAIFDKMGNAISGAWNGFLDFVKKIPGGSKVVEWAGKGWEATKEGVKSGWEATKETAKDVAYIVDQKIEQNKKEGYKDQSNAELAEKGLKRDEKTGAISTVEGGKVDKAFNGAEKITKDAVIPTAEMALMFGTGGAFTAVMGASKARRVYSMANKASKLMNAANKAQKAGKTAKAAKLMKRAEKLRGKVQKSVKGVLASGKVSGNVAKMEKKAQQYDKQVAFWTKRGKTKKAEAYAKKASKLREEIAITKNAETTLATFASETANAGAQGSVKGGIAENTTKGGIIATGLKETGKGIGQGLAIGTGTALLTSPQAGAAGAGLLGGGAEVWQAHEERKQRERSNLYDYYQGETMARYQTSRQQGLQYLDMSMQWGSVDDNYKKQMEWVNNNRRGWGAGRLDQQDQQQWNEDRQLLSQISAEDMRNITSAEQVKNLDIFKKDKKKGAAAAAAWQRRIGESVNELSAEDQETLKTAEKEDYKKSREELVKKYGKDKGEKMYGAVTRSNENAEQQTMRREWFEKNKDNEKLSGIDIAKSYTPDMIRQGFSASGSLGKNMMNVLGEDEFWKTFKVKDESKYKGMSEQEKREAALRDGAQLVATAEPGKDAYSEMGKKVSRAMNSDSSKQSVDLIDAMAPILLSLKGDKAAENVLNIGQSKRVEANAMEASAQQSLWQARMDTLQMPQANQLVDSYQSKGMSMGASINAGNVQDNIYSELQRVRQIIKRISQSQEKKEYNMQPKKSQYGVVDR